MKRSTSLGYGSKSDFTFKDKSIPGPAKYDINNYSSINENKKKGISIAKGREVLIKITNNNFFKKFFITICIIN